MPSVTRTAATALLGAASAAAHGHVVGVYTPDGDLHQGWDPTAGMGYNGDFPDVVGWSTTVQDDGFVSKESYSTPDIICHRGAEPAALAVEVAAGDVLTLEWDTWPEDHHGPVMDYLAACGAGGCTQVDKEGLEFFKISEVGCEEPGTGDDGVWGTDLLIGNGNKWQVTIPEGLAPGGYVLRHEILALHELGQPQNYPQCVNVEVTGSGTAQPAGIPATELYVDYEDFNIYQPFDKYPIPGPAMIAGASPIVEQGSGEAIPAGPIEGAKGDYFEGTPLEPLDPIVNPVLSALLPGGSSGAPMEETEAPVPEPTGASEETEEPEPTEVPEVSAESSVESQSPAPTGGSCLARRRARRQH